ncbi:ATP-binding protein [Vibrio tapetis]|uniref:C4-dicarboxylate transport sensor protein DctB n=1 Tax=Vibrio tapetis subsp. tapetis TaxID=1671868 RepID=A0A2N8ZIU4_9VIBR|nr:ATP-binding protein [Vibrio tapetis]SON51820.1 putative C4-dicarboxylate transport sensor protein [Vibrio tapetis subsp. tapetis]
MTFGRKIGLVAISFILIAISLSVSRYAATQWQLAQAQDTIEQRLLDYVGEIRRSLRRFSHLPFLITNEPETQRFLQGEINLRPLLESQLIQLDKAANTKGWYVLSKQGHVLISSLSNRSLSEADSQSIASQVHLDSGSLSIVTKVVGSTPYYYLAAPINVGFDLAGIAVVQVDLRFLTEQWFANDEAILFQNKRGTFFLSSSSELNVAKLNQIESPSSTVSRKEIYNGALITQSTLLGQKYIVQSVVLDDLQWQLTYLTPLKGLEETVSWISWSTAGACLFLILLSIIWNLRHQKHLSQLRIQKLIEGSEERLSQMINKTQVGILLLTSNGDLAEINPMAKRYFNLSDTMIKNLPAWQLFDTNKPSSTIFQLLQNLNKHHDLAEINSIETMARRSDGSHFPVLFSITVLHWHNTHYYLATVIDISKRKKAEIALKNVNSELQDRVELRTQELKDAQNELIEISKMAALGRMSSAITHELNQPLTGLRTLLTSNDLLMERGETQMLKANNKLVHTLIDRMANMTNQLKSFAFNRPEQLHAVSIPDALNEVLRIHQHRLSNVDVRVRLAVDIEKVLGEEQRIRQVLGNLIVNACDAMKDAPHPQLIISTQHQDEKIALNIIDNGSGVSEQELATIFEPFHTTKKMGDGLGLGLSISTNSMRDMKGSLSAENNAKISSPSALLNKENMTGMTFTVTFQPIS